MMKLRNMYLFSDFTVGSWDRYREANHCPYRSVMRAAIGYQCHKRNLSAIWHDVKAILVLCKCLNVTCTAMAISSVDGTVPSV